MENIHATCISCQNKGILLLGKPGSGKSDLALRMIMDKGAVLVADDRTDLSVRGNILTASCPENIRGLLEVRGLGIIPFQAIERADICLAVELVSEIKEVERFPHKEIFFIFEEIKIPLIKLYPFECSALDKLVLALGVS